MSDSPTETIFDFHVAAIAPERTHALQERAEYLLDEAVAGVASFQAVDDERLREQWAEPNRTNRIVGINGDYVTGASAGSESGLPGGVQADGSAPTERRANSVEPLRSEISGLLDVAPEEIRVFSDAELPTISYRNEPPATAPLPLFPQQAPDPSHSNFVDANQPSHFLRSADDPAPETARSFLTRPAPALGKAPPPATLPIALTAGQIRFLDEEIARLYEEVNRVLATRREITGHALSLLREAREIIYTEPHRLGRAEYDLNQVRTILERAQQSRRESTRRGFRVLLYLALWLAGTAAAGIALYLYGADLSRIASLLLGDQSRMMAHLDSFLWVMVTGSAGAVVGTILAFLTHIRSDNDFDRQHVVRFAVQPMMGIVLGILLYMLFSLLFAFMRIDLTARAVTRALPVVLALPAGLWQEWIYASLYRILSFFTFRPRRR